MGIVCASWGESLLRGRQRVAASLAGLCVGFLLYHLLGTSPAGKGVLLLASVFLLVYEMPHNYARAMFWISIMLVMLFGWAGLLDGHLLWVRIYETVLGAVAGLLAVRFILPTRSTSTLAETMAACLEALRDAQCRLVLASIQTTADGPSHKFCAAFDRLQAQGLSACEESFLDRESVVRIRSVLLRLRTIEQYGISLEQASSTPLPEALRLAVTPHLQRLEECLRRDFDRLIMALRRHEVVAIEGLDNLRTDLRERLKPFLLQDESSRRACAILLPRVYYSWKTHEVLREVASQISQEHY